MGETTPRLSWGDAPCLPGLAGLVSQIPEDQLISCCFLDPTLRSVMFSFLSIPPLGMNDGV